MLVFRRLKIMMTALIMLFIFGTPVAFGAGDTIDVGSGLNTVDQSTLAKQIISILTSVGYFIGVIAVGSLIFNGFRLSTGDERKRAEAKTNILWTLAAVVLVGMALLIVGFVAGLIKS